MSTATLENSLDSMEAIPTPIAGKIVDADKAVGKETKKNKSVWFKTKINNNATKYVLDGVTSKIQKEYFAVPGGEASRFPTAAQLAEHMNTCIQDSTKLNALAYDKDLHLGVATKTTKEKNPDSCELPPGCYTYHLNQSSGQEGLVPFNIRSDVYVDVDGALKETKNSILQFLKKRDVYKEHGLLYKLGVLMYGPPGGGKTSLLRHLINTEIPKDSVVVFLTFLPVGFLTKMSEALGDDVLKVLVFEEFTEVEEKLKKTGGTDMLLQFLDGEFSIENSITIATTNHPEKLPANIVDRPGRFDKLMNFGPPSEASIRRLLETWLKRTDIKPEEIKEVNGMSAAAIREICLLQLIEGKSFIDAAQIMKQRKNTCKSSFKDPGKVTGFAL